ncbi:MAG: cyclic nucleotide-binding domain-containing protein [Acidobacteriota bacterium]|nr:cyclic nucleotide-binding domain-containing protein [Acidobacteriota bacterium]
MVLKKLFGSRKSADDQDYTIDDLIVLERYDEAEGKLHARLKNHPKDLRSHLKLAEVYLEQKQVQKAVDQYVFVAEEYASDGFFDKGVALLQKVYRMVPMNEELPLKIERIRQRKRLEQVRESAMAGLQEGLGDSVEAGSSVIELQGLWNQLVRSSVVRLLDGGQLHRLFASMSLDHLDPGTVVAEPGSAESKLVLLVRGQMEARAVVDGEEIQMRLFGPGDIVGESTLLAQEPWPARYVIIEPAVTLQLERAKLEGLLTGNPDPKRLLNALRDQRSDDLVREAVLKLKG